MNGKRKSELKLPKKKKKKKKLDSHAQLDLTFFSRHPIMVSALAARGGARVVCASSSSSKRDQHQQQQKKRETTARTPSSIQQRLAAAAATLAATVVLVVASPSPALAEELVAAASSPSPAMDAPALFSRNCAGCHAGGGNVVSPGNTLFEADLSRNGLVTPEKVFEVIYSGKGKMPGYGANCAPKGACTFAARLSDEEVKALGDFVLERAAQGWK